MPFYKSTKMDHKIIETLVQRVRRDLPQIFNLTKYSRDGKFVMKGRSFDEGISTRLRGIHFVIQRAPVNLLRAQQY